MRRRTVLRLGGAATVGAIAGCTGGGPRETVEMTDDLRFVPETIQIPPGGTVVWDNVGRVGHTVTAYQNELPEGTSYFASGGFESEEAAREGYPAGEIALGETYEYTFPVRGTYGCFCIPHEGSGMVGTVRVR